MCFQQLKVSIYIRQCIPCGDLNKCRLGKVCIVHLRKNLTNHGGLTCPAQTAENEYLVLRLAVDKIMQLPEARAPAIAEHRCRKGTQGFAGADICGKCGKTCGFCLWPLFFQRFQPLLQFLPLRNLRTEILQLIRRNILLPPFLVLRPTVVEVCLSVHYFFRNRTSRQLCNLLFQLRRPGLDFELFHGTPLVYS